jgi:hypothetical protein
VVLYLTELLCQERFETHIHSPEQHSEQNLPSLAYFYMIDENVLEFNLMFIALLMNTIQYKQKNTNLRIKEI